MKCVLEFGVRGGNFTEVQIIPTQKLGAQLAAALVHVLFDGENTPRHTYVTSLSDINDHN